MALAKGGVGAGIDVDAIFGNIKDAKMRVGANYVKEGHFLLRMDAVKIDKKRNGVIFMAVEMTVLKVLDGSTNHKVGEAVCHWLDTTKDSFLGNVKSMIAHIMDMKPEDITKEHAVLICGPDQPMTGNVVEVQAKQIMTKANKPFTEVNYRREVPPAEALTMLDSEVQRLYFPNDMLQKAAQFNAEQAAKSAVGQAAGQAGA